MDGVSLRKRFGCLFDLAEMQSSTMAEMCALGWGLVGKCGCSGDNCGWGGGDVGGVSDITSRFYFTDSGS
jgi:hypothetical protein